MEDSFLENIIIRNESIDDYGVVEELTREAFWNVHNYPFANSTNTFINDSLLFTFSIHITHMVPFQVLFDKG